MDYFESSFCWLLLSMLTVLINDAAHVTAWDWEDSVDYCELSCFLCKVTDDHAWLAVERSNGMYPFFFLTPCAISSHYIDFCWSRCVMNTSWKKCPALIIKARSCAKWIISSIYFYRARYQIYFVEQCQQGLNPIRSTVLNFKPIF